MKKVLFSFLAAAIVLNSASFALAQDAQTAALVNGEKITKEEVSKRMWQKHFEKTVSDIIDETLLIQESKKLKIKVSKKEVDKRLNDIKSTYKDDKDFEKKIGPSKNILIDNINKELLLRKTVIKAKSIKFTNKDVKDYFDKNKASLDKPQSLKLRQIFVNTKAEADDAYMAIEAGADFAKLSSLKSIDVRLKQSGGDLGYISKGMLIKDIEKQIFSLKKGEFTKPFAINGGFTILKVEDIKKPEPAKYKKIKKDLKEAMINKAILDNLAPLITELRGKSKIEIAR